MTETLETVAPTATERRRPLVAFTPLFLWLLVSLLLITWDAYRRTTIRFQSTIDVGGLESVSATVDGKAFVGQKLKPGHRNLRITAESADPLSRDIFVWPGVNDLGVFQLKRSRGKLEFVVTPNPKQIKIKGDFFAKVFTNPPAVFDSLPVGRYQVSVVFAHSSEDFEVPVLANRAQRIPVKGLFAAVSIKSEPADANFLLSSTGNGLKIQGHTPAQLTELLAGLYTISISRGDYRKVVQQELLVGETNEVSIAFKYAELSAETVPAGAKVFLDKKLLGQTPLTVKELQPGRYALRFEHDDCLPLSAEILLKEDDPTIVVTNLISRRYSQAIDDARRLANNPGETEHALSSIEEALKERPRDKDAIDLKDRLLHSQTQSVERNQDVESQKRKQAAAEAFRKATDPEKDSRLFDTQTWMVAADFGKVREAMLRAIEKDPDSWRVENESKVDEDDLLFRCLGNGPIGKHRHCIILLSKLSDSQVQVYAKFWDYVASGKLSLSALAGAENLVPVHPNHTRNPPGAAEVRRKAIVELFKAKLQKELQ